MVGAATCFNAHFGLLQVQKAVKAGYDVRGFMYWTLIDNWEWAFAYELKFGLYEFDPSQGDSTNRRLKAGAKVTIWSSAVLCIFCAANTYACNKPMSVCA